MFALRGPVRPSRASPHSPGVILPDDLPRGSASGPVPQRVLAVGGELLGGFGVRSHELGLGGALARELGAATGFGVDVDLLFARSTSPERLADVLAGLPLDDVDVLVLVLDAADLTGKPPVTGGRLKELLLALAQRLPPFACMVVAVGGPLPSTLTGRIEWGGAALLREVADLVRAAVQEVPGSELVVLPPLPALAPGEVAAAYQEWAVPVARSLAGRAAPATAHRAGYEPLDEAARQIGVDRLGTLDAAWEAQFRRIVDFARTAYGTRYAALSVIDGPFARFLQRRGFDLVEIARQQTICDTAIHYRGGIVVGDARADARFRDGYAVRAGMTGFYVGHPVRSPEGQPVAALCVFDPEARRVDGSETIVLRDFALAAERRIWDLLPRRPVRG